MPHEYTVLAGVVFAARVRNTPLAAVFCEVAMANGVPSEAVAALLQAARNEMTDPVRASMANPDTLYGGVAAASRLEPPSKKGAYLEAALIAGSFVSATGNDRGAVQAPLVYLRS